MPTAPHLATAGRGQSRTPPATISRDAITTRLGWVAGGRHTRTGLNCVINLAPDKAQVFRDAFRILKPGGRLAISDVVNIKPLTPDLASDRALVCGCIAGAAPSTQVAMWLQAAGFSDVRVIVKEESRELVASWAPGRGIEDYVASAIIEARKPLAGEEAASCCG
jgi:arsenite methyltransferase